MRRIIETMTGTLLFRGPDERLWGKMEMERELGLEAELITTLIT